jgi:hypothetical protein
MDEQAVKKKNSMRCLRIISAPARRDIFLDNGLIPVSRLSITTCRQFLVGELKRSSRELRANAECGPDESPGLGETAVCVFVLTRSLCVDVSGCVLGVRWPPKPHFGATISSEIAPPRCEKKMSCDSYLGCSVGVAILLIRYHHLPSTRTFRAGPTPLPRSLGPHRRN